jgi:outer membrane receptor protein involved in Fe transport
LYYELNGFLRYVENYIQPQISDDEGYLQYVNQPAVSIKGLEGELRYDWDKRFQAVANISWQDARDDKRYKDDGLPSVTYNNHVPNRPWLFASAEAHYRLGNIVVGLDYQWVHWFYLSWEAYGLPETKARIPEKNLLGANVAYSWHDSRYSVSLDCQNLLDQTVYDNYKLQKPGRALFLKFRVLIH